MLLKLDSADLTLHDTFGARSAGKEKDMQYDQMPQEMKTGIDDLDRTREVLFRWFRRAFPDGKELRAPITSNVMDFLTEYVRSSFDDEVFAMHLFGFPDAKAHAREHETLREQICVLNKRTQFEGFSVGVQEAVRGALLQLVSGHAARADVKFARFLGKQNPATETADTFPQRKSNSDHWGADRDSTFRNRVA